MAETPVKKAAKPADPEPTAAPTTPPLARASESSDPAVHVLLANRQTHAANGDTDAVSAVDADLAKLGFSV